MKWQYVTICEITDFFASIVSIENKLNSMDKNYIEIKKVGGIARREKKMKSEPVHYIMKYEKSAN